MSCAHIWRAWYEREIKSEKAICVRTYNAAVDPKSIDCFYPAEPIVAALGKAMTSADLVAHAGISRALLARIERGDRSSDLSTCIAAAPTFLLAREEAIAIINPQVSVIEHEWQVTSVEHS